MFTRSFIAGALTLAYAACGVEATYSPTAKNNLVVYWGQNFVGGHQQSLLTYCQDPTIDVIPIGFLQKFHSTGGYPEINLSDACGWPYFTNTSLLSCPDIGKQIQTCQTVYKKKILLSIGGDQYKEGGWGRPINAVTDANMVWNLFGNVLTHKFRPFGNAVVDGFDLDFEGKTPNLASFAAQLRKVMDADTSKPYMLTAAPQCQNPDYMDSAFTSVKFDALFIQFYNTVSCSAASWVKGKDQNTPLASFNLGFWQNWSQTSSANKNVKLYMGLTNNAKTPGYASAYRAGQAIIDSKRFPNFGGAMLWNAAYVQAVPTYKRAVRAALDQAPVKRDVVLDEVVEREVVPLVTRHHHHHKRGSF